MKRKDIYIILGVIILAASLLGVQYLITQSQQNDNPEIIVYYNDQEVMRVDSMVNEVYELEGDYGMLYFEVNEGKVRALDSTQCPNHNCVKQGWIDINSFIPIVCLPNNIWIWYEDEE